MKRYILSALAALCYVHSAVAVLSIELTRGVSRAMPIALIPFQHDSMATAPGNTTITAIIHNDLENSGQFKVIEPGLLDKNPQKPAQVDYANWQKHGANNIIMGSTQPLPNGQYQVSYELLSAYMPHAPVLMSQTFKVSQSGLRQLAHHISDQVYQKLTGVRGVFSTKIAYVLVQGALGYEKNSLEVADADGFNPQSLLVSGEPIMSPAWSPDGKSIAYVSFEGHRSSIYLQNIATGNRQLVTQFDGINGAPAISPDGKKMLMVLTRTGNPKIYMLNLKSKQLTEMTHGFALDTEPSWAPDGRSFLFTSSRGGSPQIYRYYLLDGHIDRLTFDGNYNARASFLPDGRTIVMMHRDVNGFGIATQSLSNGFVHELTSSSGDESPSAAPNGKMILYAETKGQGVLAAVSLDGRIKLRLPSRAGNVQEPAWSPY